MFARWLSCWAVSLAVQAAVPQNASPHVDEPLTDYQVDVWTTEQGLPQNSITAIAQTTDGYLWLATFDGLVRFDGVRFVVFDVANTPQLRSSRIFGLQADRSGNLWIVTEAHELTLLANGRFTSIGPEQGLPFGGVSPMAPDSQGRIWFASFYENGFYRVENCRLIKVLDGNGLGPAQRLLDDEQGNLWARLDTNLRRIDPPDLKSVPIPGRVLGLGRDSRGIIVASGTSVYRFKDSRWHERARFDAPSMGGAKLVEDRGGTVWGAAWDGNVWKTAADGSIHTFKLLPDQNPSGFRCIFEDLEGSIWIGSDGAGLFRIKPRLIHCIASAQGLASDLIKSVAADSTGNIWALSAAGLSRLATNPLRVQETFATPSQNNWVVTGDRVGNLWVGNYGNGLSRWKEGLSERAMFGSNAFKGTCLALHLNAQGTLWAGGDFGAVTLEGLNVQRVEIPFVDLKPIRTIAESRKGTFYFGTGGTGLLVRTGNHWQQFLHRNGLPDDQISALYADGDETLWIGTANHGLARFKEGTIFVFETLNEWPMRSVNSILEDDLGSIWFGSNRGLFRVLKSELNQFADGKISRLNIHSHGVGDGLATTEFANGQQPTACKSADGKLWFATVRGIAMIDPGAIAVNARPPPVIIEEVFADANRQSIEPGNSVTISPGRRHLEIRYTALSYLAPEKVRFRVKFDGLDDKWVDADIQRTVHYSQVPPGEYRFHVKACNNDGLWNETGQSLALTILPFYWQTLWFRTLLGVASAALLLGVYSIRSRRRRQIETMRRHIAQDLHDEVGSNLGSILLLSKMLQSSSVVEKEDREDALRIQSVAEETARVVRDIAWFTNPTFDSRDGLLDRMESVAGETLGRLEVTFQRPQSQMPDRPLSLEFRRNTFAIFKECLHNIVKHSQATHVEITIQLTEDTCHLTIQDNGLGFDPGQPTTGNGLGNLRRRASELRADLKIKSTPGQGTAIELSIPWSHL